MKKLLLLGCLLFASAETNLYAQKITVILVRHAEKDISPGADKVNPDLTEAGRQRALRLVEKVKANVAA